MKEEGKTGTGACAGATYCSFGLDVVVEVVDFLRMRTIELNTITTIAMSPRVIAKPGFIYTYKTL